MFLFYAYKKAKLKGDNFLFCNKKLMLENLKLLFKALKDAQLASKRCPFEVLLTPFWSSIKHLLDCDFVTVWFVSSYKGA